MALAGFHNIPGVRHFAVRLDDWYRGYYLAYERHTTGDLRASFLNQWNDFLELLIERLPDGCPNIASIKKIQNRANVSDAGLVSHAGIGRYLYYRDEFSDIVKTRAKR
ncbi:MAG: hypothetical protein HOP17_08585 [Acidobacteria bacterium]|nr:hypothetical protein [Acidobacteriota bacterium]